jgi:energy-coupling factor transporter transmembrane protein EcfT
MSGEQIAIIIVNILSLPFFIDGIIIFMIIVSFLLGLAKKGWHSLWRFVFVALLLAGAAIFAVKPLATWLASDAFFSLIGYQPVVDYGGDHTVTIHSFTELIVVMGRLTTDRAKFTAEYSSELAFNIAKSVAWFAIVLIVHVVSWIVSALLWPLVRLAIPARIRKKKMRVLGGLIGIAQTLVIVASYMFATSAFSPGFTYLFNSGNYASFGINDYLVGIGAGINSENSWIFSWLSLEGKVFQYKIGEDHYFVNLEFLDLSESLINDELTEEERDLIIAAFEEECFNDEGEFVCTI